MAIGAIQGTDVVLELRGISKSYPDKPLALDEVSLQLHRGEVYGLVGSNGAGKTTLMRSILGLVHADRGSGTILGRPFKARTNTNNVGALIEAPAFHGSMSGRSNLRLLAAYWNLDKSDVELSLERVGLVENAQRRYSRYSLGMKQRLGIAAAILGGPTIVFLDEPTNGLDPAAIAETRDLLRGLSADGHTVMLSSHLLAEVEQLCDRVGILDHGRLIAEGTVAQLRALGAVPGTRLRVTAEPLDLAIRTVDLLIPGAKLELDPSPNTFEVVLLNESTTDVNRALLDAGVIVRSLAEVSETLEETFFSVVNRSKKADIGGGLR